MLLLNHPTGKKPVTGFSLPCFILLLLLLNLPVSIKAQGKASLSGQLIDLKKEYVPFATVTLQSLEGKLIKGSLSDTSGIFSFNDLQFGNYHLEIKAMGYVAFKTKLITLSAGNYQLDMGEILLNEDITTLNSITIMAQKKLIEQQVGKMVINIENSVLAEGNSALEILERVPGVKVDDEGNISLKGRSGVMILMNGKQTYLSPKELSLLLKGTNSTSIAKIEVMTNPSAKYDAAGNGGVINIQMKKSRTIGFNGTVNANTGASRNARYGSGMSLNYRNNKINLYGSYDYAYRGETEYLDFVRRFYEDGIAIRQPNRTSYQDTKTNEPLHTNNFRLGLDYELDSINSIGFLINGNIGKYTHDSKTGNNLIQNDGKLLSRMLTSNYDQQHWENLTYNLNYLHQFKKQGRELSADVDYASNSFTSKLNLKTLSFPLGQAPAIEINRRGYVPATTNVYVAKIDYVDPISKSVKLEGGLKSSIIDSDNNLKYELLENGRWNNDENGSNHFKYKEQIHAAYLNLSKKFKGFSIMVGLRGEYTQTKGHQITTDSVLLRNYFQLFPSVFVNKPLGENHQVQLAYSRRIERPDYSDLNPFRVFRDPLLFYQGNPFLKPELINTLEISHTFKNKYTTAISYNQTSDVITWISGQIDELNTTFEAPQNLSKLINYGISFTASTEFFKWWSGIHFANIFRNEYSGIALGGNFDNQTTSFSVNSQNVFKLGKTYTAELSGNYYSGSVYGISTYKGNYVISTGLQKSILKGMGNVKLIVNDVFQSSAYKERTVYQQIDMRTHKRPDSRRVMLSFSYRFGQQEGNQRERRMGSEEILNRVKGGG